MNKIKPPYNINQASQELALQALGELEQVNTMILEIVSERKRLEQQLQQLKLVELVHPSDANFLLVKVSNARGIYEYLLDKAIVVRDRSRVELCEGCLRITVGTPAENEVLLKALADYNGWEMIFSK